MASRLLVLGAAGLPMVIAAVHIAGRRRDKKRAGEQKTQQSTHRELHPGPVKELVHVVGYGSPPAEDVEAMPQQPGRSSSAMLVAAILMVFAVVTLSVLRKQYDLAAGVVVAWVFVLLAQVGQQQGWMSRSSRPDRSVPDATVEVADAAEPVKLPDINGTWIKDNAASDSMEPALQLLRLNGMMRTAVRLIKGVKITLDDAHFDFAVFSVISWFKVTEHYSMAGTVSYSRRRDLRRGKSAGVARLTPWGTLRLEYEWGSPYEGQGVDEFSLDEQGRLHIACNLNVGGETARYTLVYHRK